MLRGITVWLGLGFFSALALFYLARSRDEEALARRLEESLEALRGELFKH